MKKNVIPRKFNRIICKMLVPTSESKIGDIFHIYKNDFGYIFIVSRLCYEMSIFVNFWR